jgi:Fe-Mn family superoxide dismutase
MDKDKSKKHVLSLENSLEKLIALEVKQSTRNALGRHGLIEIRKDKLSPAPSAAAIKTLKTLTNVSKSAVSNVRQKLKEAFVVIPRSFALRTERLSSVAKQAHEKLYKDYVEAFNKISTAVDAAGTEEAKSTTSAFRSLKIDEVFNLNAIKLHELYFANISDVASEISVDALPYIRLARDFGTFEKWQFNFMACAMSARSGWAVTYYEPYRNIYTNSFIDSHDTNIPLGAIPVLVIDMWEHAYFKDYADDKKSYLISMMREINWSVVEARMIVAEKGYLDNLYRISPVVNDAPQTMLSAAQAAGGQAPIVDVVPSAGTMTIPPVGGPGPLAPTAPPSPSTQTTAINRK